MLNKIVKTEYWLGFQSGLIFCFIYWVPVYFILVNPEFSLDDPATFFVGGAMLSVISGIIHLGFAILKVLFLKAE